MNYPTEIPVVLLVDDDHDDLSLLYLALEDSIDAYEVEVCHDGEEAIAHLQASLDKKRKLPNIIFLDIKMPKLNGFETLQALQANPVLKNIPCIILTSSEEPADVQAAYAAGAKGYIVKPMALYEFSEKLQAALKFWLTNTPPSV